MRVFMCTAGTFGIPGVDDQRNARRPEARVALGAGNLRGEFRREGAVHGRAVHAGLFEQPALEQRPCGRRRPARPSWSVRSQGVSAKRPGSAPGSARAASSRRSRASSAATMRPCSAANHTVAALLARLQNRVVPSLRVNPSASCLGENPSVCRRASPSTMAAATATLSERSSGAQGNRAAAHRRRDAPPPGRPRIRGRPCTMSPRRKAKWVKGRRRPRVDEQQQPAAICRAPLLESDATTAWRASRTWPR